MNTRIRLSSLGLCLAALVGCGGAAPCPPQPVPVAQNEAPPPAPVPPTPPAPAPESEDTNVVVLDGTSAVSPALHAALTRYQNTRAAYVEGLSDDGRTLYVTTRFADTAQLHRVTMPMGARRQLTFEDEPIADARAVPGVPGAVVYSKDVGGNENWQLYYLAEGALPVLLTDGEHRHETFVLSADGRQVAYNGNGRNGRDMDLYVGPVGARDGQRLFLERTGAWSPLEFSRDGRFLLASEYVSILDSRLYLIEIATQRVVRLSPEQPVAAYRTAVFSADGRRVYVASDREGEFVEAYELPIGADGAPGAFVPLTRDVPWSVEDLALSADGRTLAIVTNEDGFSVLRLLDTRTRRARVITQVPRGRIVSLRMAGRANVLGMTLAGASRTGDAYTLELGRGTLTRWTDSEMGGLDPSAFVEPEAVRFASFDGKQIPALYYRPRGEGAHPVIVDIHGGPEGQSRPAFNPIAQYMVSRGVAWIQPNVRGSDGYGKTYLALDDGMRREDSVKDIGALLDWVGTRTELDRARIGVYGGSYGGYMVLATLVHYSDRIRAGVDVVGIANFVTFLEHTSPYRVDLRRVEYGDERVAEMRAFQQSISPANNAAQIRSALFVAHGANDPRVPVAEAEQIVQAVRGNGVPVWYMLARNEGHGFTKKANRDLFQGLMVTFFAERLGLN